MPADQSHLLLTVLPALSGACFAVVGICYRLAGPRGILPTHIMLCMAAGGALFFGLRCVGEPVATSPAPVWALGIASGLAQWGCILLISLALRLGPLSPMWCALNLSFVPVIIYSWGVFGEPISLRIGAGIGLAILTVVLGSLVQGQTGPCPADRSGAAARALAYAALLIGLLLSNSLMHVAIKILGSTGNANGVTLMATHGDLYYLLLYLGIGIPLSLSMVARRDGRILRRVTWQLGVVAALGSIGGVWLLGICSAMPGAIVFTLSGVMSILGAAAASVLHFGERADALWWAMMVSAIGSVALMSG